jgi:putative methionine-R-sulfoxide reductase with GAF domain
MEMGIQSALCEFQLQMKWLGIYFYDGTCFALSEGARAFIGQYNCSKKLSGTFGIAAKAWTGLFACRDV